MNRRPDTPTRFLRRWHRRTGLLLALFLAFLALSGLLLNHGEAFELEQTAIDTPWLMAWYGLKPAVPDTGYVIEENLFAAQGEVRVLSGRRLKAAGGTPVGAVKLGEQVWIASAEEIELYDNDAQLLDRIGRNFLPATPIRRIGIVDGRLAANIGNDLVATDDGIAWQALPDKAKVAWSRPSPLSDEQRSHLAPFFRPSLPLSRIVADIHSGRIFGSYGPLLIDALGAVLLFLAGTGLWINFKTRSGQPKR